MNKEMKNAFKDLIIRFNGEWKENDFKRLLWKWEANNKLVYGGKEKYICWVYNPKLFNTLMKMSKSAKELEGEKG